MASLRHFSIALTANTSVSLDVTGDLIKCITATDVFDVEPEGSNRVELNQGLGVRFTRMASKWRITSPTTQTVLIYIGEGDISDTAQSVTVLRGAATSSNYGNVDISTVAIIRAANTARSSILVQSNEAAGGDNLFIGNDASVTSTNGIVLVPGASVTLTVDDDIYGIAASGTIDVRYFEEIV